jgi:hypothetical protein
MNKPTPCEHPKGFKTSVQIGKEYCSFCGETRDEKPTPEEKWITKEEHNRIFLNREREFARVKALAFNREKQLKKRLQLMGEKLKEWQK